MIMKEFEGEEQEFKGDVEGQPAANESAWELRRCVERRKLWRSSGELLGRFSVGERFHRLLLRPYLLIVGPSWICLLPRLESVRSQDGFTAGTSVHRGKGGCHQHWIWLRGLHGNKEAIVEQGGASWGKTGCALIPLMVVFLFWNEKSETVSSGMFVFRFRMHEYDQYRGKGLTSKAE